MPAAPRNYFSVPPTRPSPRRTWFSQSAPRGKGGTLKHNQRRTVGIVTAMGDQVFDSIGNRQFR